MILYFGVSIAYVLYQPLGGELKKASQEVIPLERTDEHRRNQIFWTKFTSLLHQKESVIYYSGNILQIFVFFVSYSPIRRHFFFGNH